MAVNKKTPLLLNSFCFLNLISWISLFECFNICASWAAVLWAAVCGVLLSCAGSLWAGIGPTGEVALAERWENYAHLPVSMLMKKYLCTTDFKCSSSYFVAARLVNLSLQCHRHVGMNNKLQFVYFGQLSLQLGCILHAVWGVFFLSSFEFHLWNINSFESNARTWQIWAVAWYSGGEGALCIASNLNSAAWETGIIKARKEFRCGAEGKCGNSVWWCFRLTG